MYAVIVTGGKQYKVEEGTRLNVEKLEGVKGDKIDIADILLIGGIDVPKVGKPKVPGACVSAEIVAQSRSKKAVVYKRKKRKGFQKTRSHRQPYTSIKVLSIKAE